MKNVSENKEEILSYNTYFDSKKKINEKDKTIMRTVFVTFRLHETCMDILE